MSTLQARLPLVLFFVAFSILAHPLVPSPTVAAAPHSPIDGPFLGSLVIPVSRDGTLPAPQVAPPPPIPFSLPFRRSLPPRSVSPALPLDPVRQTRLAA